MPPETLDARRALIATAARLLAEHGPDALTTRRVAAEAGTSTMAVYTHFGSMEELRAAIRDLGFAELGGEWDAVRMTRDPVADLSVCGATYMHFAVRNPHLYRAMFFEAAVGDHARAISSITGPRLAIIRRCMQAGRFADADPQSVLWQLWAPTHGIVGGTLSGVLDLAAAERLLQAIGVNLYVGFGDRRAAARRSIERATARTARRIAALTR